MTAVTITDCFRKAALAAKQGRAWIRGDKRDFTYVQLVDRIRRITALLAARGIKLGDRVVIASREDLDAASLFVALLCNGVTAINIDPETGQDRARALIGKANPALIILDDDLAAKWQLSETGHAWIAMAAPAKTGAKGGILGGLLKAKPATGLLADLAALTPIDPPEAIPPETLAYILFTSGTTQQPKGVCISHRALTAHLTTLSRVYGYGAESAILNTLMLSHADGMIQGPVISFFNGATLHRPMRFEINTIDRLLDSVFQRRITHMVAVPTMLSLMTRLGGHQRDAFQGGDFRLLVSCGAALEPALWSATADMFGVKIINVYGLTETVVGGVFAGEIVGEIFDTAALGSIGRPIDCELSIVDELGQPVAEGSEGELLMRGDLLMSGYFDDPVQTQEVLHDGWFHTGDIAAQDAAGLYHIRGRKKNIVIRGGLNIHPEEIAEVLNRHPQVREAIAFGLPDADWGEKMVAVVAGSDIKEAELLTFCAGFLEPRKVPSRIAVAAELPKGRSGKVIISEARQLLEQAQGAPASAAAKTGDIEMRLLDLAANCFKVDRARLSLSSTPHDITGWDSLAHMEFVVALETAFGKRLSARDVVALDRLDKALALITG